MTSTSGIGLHIVGAITDRWRVLAGSSTRVRFEPILVGVDHGFDVHHLVSGHDEETVRVLSGPLVV